MTHQRLKILEHLRSVKSHPTAEMVYESVKRDMPTISLGTVYRNLNLLADHGEILKLEINGEYRFDGDMCNHQHAVCSCCNKIFDISIPATYDIAIKNARLRGFHPTCVTIIYKGKCRRCS